MLNYYYEVIFQCLFTPSSGHYERKWMSLLISDILQAQKLIFFIMALPFGKDNGAVSHCLFYSSGIQNTPSLTLASA